MNSRRSIPGLAALALVLGLTLAGALFAAPAAMAQDTTPPTLVKVEVEGRVLTYTFNEELNRNSVPEPSAFRVHIFSLLHQGAFNLPAGTPLAIHGREVRATLPEAVSEGQAVNARYWWRTWAGGGPKLQDLAGNELEKTEYLGARNLADRTPPVFVGAATSTDGTRVYIDFHDAGWPPELLGGDPRVHGHRGRRSSRHFWHQPGECGATVSDSEPLPTDRVRPDGDGVLRQDGARRILAAAAGQ